MKPDKKADDLLREKLNSYSSPLPAGLFDAMDKKREEQQAAGVFGWRVKAGVSAMVLLLAVGLVYWQTNSNTTTKAETSTINNKEQIAVNTLNESSQIQETTQTQTVITEEQNSNIQIDNKQKKAFSDNTQQQTKLSNSSASFSTKVASVTTTQSDVFKQINSIEAPTESKKIFLNIKDTDNTSVITPVIPSDNIASDVANEADMVEQKIASQSVLVSPLKSKGLLSPIGLRRNT